MLLASCGANAIPGPSPLLSVGFSAASPPEDAKVRQHIYWTLFAGSSYPQVQVASVPLRAKSKATSIFNNARNSLVYSSGMHVDALGRLWILSFGKYNGAPGSVMVFKLPLKATSAPQYTFVLSDTSDPDHLTFDASGNLWVNSHSNSSALEYIGPFTKSGTLSPKIILTKGLSSPEGIAVDKSGNLYVANFASTGTNSIAIFTKPISNKQPKFLDGLGAPGGLLFDKHGNLYASNNTASLSAIVRYNSNHLRPGDSPSIVDSSGLNSAYESDFALMASGDLYFANCGSNAGIDVYPTSKRAFTSKLAPLVVYTNSYITSIGCAWGIAIK